MKFAEVTATFQTIRDRPRVRNRNENPIPDSGAKFGDFFGFRRRNSEFRNGMNRNESEFPFGINRNQSEFRFRSEFRISERNPWKSEFRFTF